MGFLSNITNGIFGGGSNAPGAAMPYYQQNPGIDKKYMDPYINAGTNALGGYSSKLNQLMNDPTGFVNNIMSSYTQSPQYKTALAASTTAGNNAASAGGTLGTGAEQGALQANANKLSMDDQQQYLSNAMQPFLAGLSGTQGLTGMGANMSQAMARALTQNNSDEAGLAYQKKEDQDNGLMNSAAAIAAMIHGGSK